MDRKKWLSLGLGFVVTILCVGWLVYEVEWQKLQTQLTRIDWRWCVLAVGLYLLGHVFRGIRCAWILRPHKQISWFEATQVVWIGYATNNVLPARLGELVRSYVLARRERISTGISISTLLVERILDGLSIVGILVIAAFWAPTDPWIRRIGWFAGLLFVGAMSVMLLARLSRRFFERLLSWSASRLPASVGERAEGFGHRLLDGTACLQGDRYMVGVLFLSVLIWVVEGAMFLVLLPAFGLPFSPMTAYLAMSITNLGVLLPSTPGHVGTFHFCCTKALLLAGAITPAGQSIGVGYALVLHALQYVPVTLIGFWSLYHYGFNLKTLWHVGDAPPSVSEATTTA
ncbi:MAG: flippase-like domain-containing protein [Myxococcales bacterium]|nr:flippase-like domain-containing protein [Myxococcales bacterium]MCB9643128.1 flippase-like domain-containing protein [Myxococcales bacterium]